MKKIVFVFLIITSVLLNFSCAPKGRGYRHINMNVSFIDEYNNYCDEYYLLNESDNKKIKYSIYNKINNEKVDEILINRITSNFYARKIYIDNGIIYFFVDDNTSNFTYCYYKTIGLKENIEDQCIIFSRDTIEINVNGLTFLNSFWVPTGHIPISGSFVKEYNVIQLNGSSNIFYASYENYNEIYNIEFINNTIMIKNYYDENINRIYNIPQEIIDAEYIGGKNTDFNYGCERINDKVLGKGYYALAKKTTKLMEDDNLYFAYSKYLGEFERANCPIYGDCILSNRISEILRFNTKTKQIERVALIPETYTVLAIYEDCAIIMNNKRIGTYYYDTKKIEDIIEIDVAGEVFNKKEGKLLLKIYFTNKKFDKIKIELFDIDPRCHGVDCLYTS